MEQIFSRLEFLTNGEGFIDITNDLNLFIEKNNFDSGILNLTSLHTSCSLTINENADPTVQEDLETHFNMLAPEGQRYYKHTLEGPDDMPAHIKSSLTNNQISLSIKNSKLLLGTWQGIYLFEHRLNPQKRTVIHHFLGET